MPETLLERCRAYAVRLRPGQAFSHETAALMHEMPLPVRMSAVEPLHVSCVRPSTPPRTTGVVGHRLAAPAVLVDVQNMPVCAPSEAWVQLAPRLTVDELIILADHLLTVSPLDDDMTRRLLRQRIAAGRRPAVAALRNALHEARRPVLSPGETRVRLLLVRAGIREPELNAPVHDASGRYLGRPDLLWRHERVMLEYEGDGHRERQQFRADIERYELFRDAGWEVIRVSAADLHGARCDALVARVRQRLQRAV
ncbi:hypothetical protein [uncultured Amnibacterium sp.]|uniref:hypothetical protein n=1 Tax=uncultured Amnibacterium sp. TaxID=1631851 RepID=UPI0035CB7D43